MATAKAAAGARFSLRAVKPEFTTLYVGFLIFLIAIITYRIPVGKAGLALGFLALAFSKEKLRFPTPMVAFTLLLAIAFIGAPASNNPAMSWAQLMDSTKTWLIAVMAYNSIRTIKQFRFVVLWICALYAFVPVRPVLMNYALGITTAGRAEGPFIYINPNDLASISLLALGFTLWVLNTEPMQKSLRLIGYGFAATIAVMILLTQSRAGFLGLVMMGIPYAMSSARRGVKPLALMVAAMVGAAVFVPASAWTRIAGLSKLTSRETIKEADPEGSAEQRFVLAKTAVEIMVDHPFKGVGIGAVGDANRKFRRGIGGRDTHNTYLKVGAELGFPGLILFMVVVVGVWQTLSRVRLATRKAEPQVSAGFGYIQNGLFGFLIASFFGSYGWLSIFHVFLAVMWSGATLWLVPEAPPLRAAVARGSGGPQGMTPVRGFVRRAPVIARRRR